MPYGWDYFMENVADPAHVPVSHQGLHEEYSHELHDTIVIFW